MKRKEITEVLREAREDGEIARVRTRTEPRTKYDGYVVGLSERFLLLHVTDGGQFIELNGYMVFPLKELKDARILDDHDSFVHRALRLKGIRPLVPQGVDLDGDLPALLASVDAHFPLITLHQGRRDPDTIYIGRVAKLGNKSVTLREIDPGAKWNRTRRYRYSDITRVDFGGGYERTLWLVSEDDRARTGRPLDGNDIK